MMLAALLLGLAFLRPALAQDRLRVADVSHEEGSAQVARYLDVLPEPDQGISIPDLLADQRQPVLPWQQNHATSPGFGFNSQPHWFRLVLSNGSQQTAERWLEIRNAMLDEVRFVQVNEAGEVVQTMQTGDGMPTSQRPFIHHNLVLPVQIPAAETHYLYFRVATSGALEFPLQIWTPPAFQARDQLHLLLFGSLFGVLAVMCLYNFFIYTLFRDLSLLYYAGYALGLMLFLAAIHGFANQHLWPESDWWRRHALVLIIPFILVCAVMFTSSFLQLHRAFPFMTYGAFVGAGVCWALLLAAFFVDYAVLIRILAAMIIPVSLLAIGLGMQRWLTGFKPARYFILAWIVFLLSISYFSLAKFGVFELTPVAEYVVQWGAVLEMVLFAFALADRLNNQRRDSVAAQGKALALQRRINEELEERVELRTLELRSAMDELAVANARLQALTLQDGLTGIYNRRYFDNKIDKEWQRALRNRESLALLLLDIDHFKSFNDQHGHLVGDECLKQLALVVQSAITRPSDAVARYGGEEFVVVLPDTTVDGALHVAERIRRLVQAVRIPLEGGQVGMTVSVGAVAMVPSEQHSAQTLIACADQALYQAKQAGRNCTKVAACAMPA